MDPAQPNIPQDGSCVIVPVEILAFTSLSATPPAEMATGFENTPVEYIHSGGRYGGIGFGHFKFSLKGTVDDNAIIIHWMVPPHFRIPMVLEVDV